MHLTDDDLILHYYGELDTNAAARVSDHLGTCPECHASFTTLQRVLTAVESAPAPEIAEGFERTVWARLQPELGDRRAGAWTSRLKFSPARLAWAAGIVMVVAAAFFAGRVSQHAPVTAPVETAAALPGLRERVLLADLGDHLDRSQMMLIELVSADAAGDVDLPAERVRAQQLVADNRLYRQTATANGNVALAAVLDDLEQVLVDVAAGPDTLSAADLMEVRQRIENKGLLLKVRVLSSEVQKRQKTEIRARAGQSS
jgi:hypothetical protein